MEEALRLARVYLDYDGGCTQAVGRLDAVLRAAADLPLRELRDLYRGLAIPSRPRYDNTNSDEHGMRLGDLRRALYQRRRERLAYEDC